MSPPHVFRIWCSTSGWDLLASLGHHAAHFNGFRVLASLLYRRRSTKVNQTLHDVWPSSRLKHYIYTFRGSCPWRNFGGAKFTLRSSLAFFNIGRIIARHSSDGRQPNFAAWYEKWNKNSSADEIANVNFLRRHRTCRGQRLRPLNRLPNCYYKYLR